MFCFVVDDNPFTETLSVAELPAFNVTLVPKKYHLSLEDEELEVKVYAE